MNGHVDEFSVRHYLETELQPIHLIVEDISSSCGLKFELTVVSAKFEDLSLLESHRCPAIYDHGDWKIKGGRFMFIHGACLLHRLGKRSSLATKHEEEVKGQDFDALDYRFKSACAYVSYVISKISSEDLLYFYARYKQAIFGDAEPSDVPYGWKIKDKAKYEEWRKLTGMTKDEAKRQYVEKLIDLDIGWIPEKASFGYGPRHSILLQPNDTDNDGEIDSELLENRNWYSVLESDDSCKIDNTLQSNKKLLGMRAENELTPLLWAADRGKANAVECLLRHGADLNETDNDGQTALDYAIACSHENVIKILSKYGETNSSEVIEESECCTAQPT